MEKFEDMVFKKLNAKGSCNFDDFEHGSFSRSVLFDFCEWETATLPWTCGIEMIPGEKDLVLIWSSPEIGENKEIAITVKDLQNDLRLFFVK